MTEPTPPTVVEIDPWDLRDPSRLVLDVARRVRFDDGTAIAALVDEPADAQRVTAIEEIGTAYLAGEDDAAQEAAIERLDALQERWGHPDRHADHRQLIVTFVVRRGLCVWGVHESAWFSAWRRATFSYAGTDLVVVTEHGWWHWLSDHADHRPALTRPRRHRGLAVVPDVGGSV